MSNVYFQVRVRKQVVAHSTFFSRSVGISQHFLHTHHVDRRGAGGPGGGASAGHQTWGLGLLSGRSEATDEILPSSVVQF